MVGPWPLALHHDYLQYMHHIHLMQQGKNRGVTFALYVHDVYTVNNYGEELKAKAPPSIGYALFQIEIVTDGISRHAAYILSFVIMSICIFN